jgi:hypothetical protein
MGEMKIEHVLLFLVGAFLVYHMMKDCGCNVEGLNPRPSPKPHNLKVLPIIPGVPAPDLPPPPPSPPPPSRYERCLDRVLHNYEHGMIRGQDGSPSAELLVARQMACKYGY